MKENPPKLTIKQNLVISDSDRNFEVLADEFIPLGSVLPPYSGKAKEDNMENAETAFAALKNDPYVLAGIDAERHGNVTRFFNCGWPNVVCLRIKPKGVVHQSTFIVVEPEGIKAGEPILFDYTANYISLAWGKQILFGREKMRQYFKENGFQKLLVDIETKQDFLGNQMRVKALNKKDYCELTSAQTKITFPLNNPTAILDLHFSGIVPVTDWLKELKNSTTTIFSLWKGRNTFHYTILYSFMLRIVELDKILSTKGMPKETISQWVLKSIGKLEMMKILKGMDMIADTLQKDPRKVKTSLQEYEKELETFLSTYDWNKDEHAPLSKNRRRFDQQFASLIEAQSGSDEKKKEKDKNVK